MKILTRKGAVELPIYIPTLTFGNDFPLDDYVRPFLTSVFTPAIMSSYRFIHKMTPEQQPPQSFWLDSGAFALLSVNQSSWQTQQSGISVIEVAGEEGKAEILHPKAILEKQEQIAEVGFTLDIPVPLDCEPAEAERRLQASLNNALWALKNRRRQDLVLYASLPVYNVQTTRVMAEKLSETGFDGIALGGLVPRRHQHDLLIELVRTVKAVAPNLPLHLFGMGQPDLCARLFAAGADSVDSSSWVRYAASGKLFGIEGAMPNPSRREQQHLALMNLASARQSVLPATAPRLPLASWFVRPEWFQVQAKRKTTEEG